MKPSGSVLFPYEEDEKNRSLARAHTVEDTFKSAIKAFVMTPKLSRVGNPIGSFVPSLIHETFTKEEEEALSDDFRQELSEQFPELDIVEAKIERDKEITSAITYNIKVKFTSQATEVSELLFSISSQNQ